MAELTEEEMQAIAEELGDTEAMEQFAPKPATASDYRNDIIEGAPDYLTGAFNSFGQGGTLGQRDELIGRFSNNYESARDSARESQNQFANEFPVTDAVAKMGGAGVAAYAASRIPGAGKLFQSKNLLQNMGLGIGESLALGYGESENGYKGGDALFDTALGAIGGGAGYLFGRMYDRIKGKTDDVARAEQEAQEKIDFETTTQQNEQKYLDEIDTALVGPTPAGNEVFENIDYIPKTQADVVAKGEAEGFKYTKGTETGHKYWLTQEKAARNKGTAQGVEIDRIRYNNQKLLNKQAGESIGINNASVLNGETLGAAKQQLVNAREKLVQGVGVMDVNTNRLTADLDALESGYEPAFGEPNKLNKVIDSVRKRFDIETKDAKKINDDIAKLEGLSDEQLADPANFNKLKTAKEKLAKMSEETEAPAQFTGEQYNKNYKALGKNIGAELNKSNPDMELVDAYRQVQTMLDDMIEDNIGFENIKLWQNNRDKFRNLIALSAPNVRNTVTGDINHNSLRKQIERMAPELSVRGEINRHPLNKLYQTSLNATSAGVDIGSSNTSEIGDAMKNIGDPMRLAKSIISNEVGDLMPSNMPVQLPGLGREFAATSAAVTGLQEGENQIRGDR